MFRHPSQSQSPAPRSPRAPRRARRGVAAALAMLYLVLFSTLAIGFYAAFTLSTQISYNERDARRGLAAAESGMEFIRYHLWALDLERTAVPETLFDHVYDALQTTLNGTPNLGGGNIARVGDSILIPGNPNEYIELGDGSAFRVTITRDGKELLVTTQGRTDTSVTASGGRAVRLRYSIAEKTSSIFNFGVASRGPVSLIGNTSINGGYNAADGSVLSATTSGSPPLTMQGNTSISGDVSIVNPDPYSIQVGGNCSIGLTKNPNIWRAEHLHVGIEPPEFPVVDTTDYRDYILSSPHTVVSGNSGGNKTFGNIYVPANTNPTFNGNTKITGLIYIEAPNKVSFSGNLDLHGAIVVENDPTGDITTNVIDFGGNVDFEGVNTLPASYGELRSMDGAMLLAPNFHLKMRGNFGTIGGSIVASKIEFTGNAGGIVKGTIINYDDVPMTLQGNSDIIIESEGAIQQPHGLYFGSRYVPLPGSYEEVFLP